ncbi:MAG: dienelactone hydrolase family protein [Fimbriimonas sp.]
MAKVVTQRVEYKDGDTVLEGFLAYDDATTKPTAGIGIVHDWNGLDGYEEGRAKQLAEQGYVAFALDIYGKGIRPTNPADSGKQATIYRSDRALFRARLKAGMDVLANHPKVNKQALAAIGYCFGGTGVLELARSGYPVAGVVSFHGGLETPTPAAAGDVKGKVLVFHANDDPAVPQAQLIGLLKELKDAKVDFQVTVFNLATHAFTVPGGSYNADADRRSFAGMLTFFGELFSQTAKG